MREASPILDDCSIEICPGMTAIVGPSGAGKTSLLYVLSGLDSPDSGHVFLDGEDLYALNHERRTHFLRERVGFVFQDYNLVPYLSVEENVLLPMSLAGRKADSSLLIDLLESFALSRKRTAKATELSGGEKQRCALIRALLLSPKVLFADEPTGALDTENSRIVLETLKNMATNGCSVIVVTHDPDAAALADRVAFMRDGLITHTTDHMDPEDILGEMRGITKESYHV